METNKNKLHAFPIIIAAIGGMLINFTVCKLTDSIWIGLPFCFGFGFLVRLADSKFNK
jgi:hypothetical protein